MKKITTAILLSAALVSSAFANKGPVTVPNACAYSDFFHLGDDSVGPLTIASLTGDANVIVVQKDTSFYIKDTPECPSDGGVAKVRYQKDGSNYCDLTIEDGPNKWDPDVSSICKGSLHYSGIKYDGLGSHAYSISFY